MTILTDRPTIAIPYRLPRRVARSYSAHRLTLAAQSYADETQRPVTTERHRDGSVTIRPHATYHEAVAARDAWNASGKGHLTDVTSPTPVGPWLVEVGNQYGTRALGYPSRDRARKAAAEWREQGFTVGPVRRTS